MSHDLLILILQIAVILAAARATAALFRHLGQPAVVGEMIAGLLLGPSVFGAAAPQVHEWIFPTDSLPLLRAVSQVGVIVFMFVVGTEFDAERLRPRARAAVTVSLVGVVVPLVFGAALAFALYEPYGPPDVRFLPFALFLAIAMSITAFPVLARIIRDRGLMTHPIGQLALACAAVDDAIAWCLLAVAVAVASESALAGPMASIGLTAVFIAVMVGGIRPLLPRVVPRGGSALLLVPAALALLAASAVVTSAIGLHAIFGAFLAGVAFSHDMELRDAVRRRFERLGYRVLVPLFFAFAGLRTEVGLLQTAASWLTCAAIVAIAIAAKLGACAAAARWSGQSWRDALTLGALMNTRGLMQLVVLNIGYDLGLLTPHLFAMFVLMAIVTTSMAGPLVTRIRRAEPAGEAKHLG